MIYNYTNKLIMPITKNYSHSSNKGKQKLRNILCQKEKVPSLLYIKETGNTTKEQLLNIFQNAIDRSSETCSMKITMPVNQQGEYKGFAFIWFSSPVIPNMLTGHNKDGSQLTSDLPIIQYSKYYKELDERLNMIERSGNKYQDMDIKTNWWYICAMEEDKIKQERRKKYIILLLDPLLELEYDEIRFGKISFEYGTIRRYKEGQSSNVLFGRLDKRITENDIRNEMIPFATTIGCKYPDIHISHNEKYNVVYITFSSNEIDAQTARKIVYDYEFIT